MGLFMAVIEKIDVLDARSFCETHCIFFRISVQSAQSGKIDRFPPYPEKFLANRGE